MVAVALHHARGPFEERRPVPAVVADAHVVGVALDVGLVDDVHPQFVAKVVERAVVGVVAGPNRCDVVGAHRLQVGADVVGVDRLALVGMVIVAVDTEDPDRLTVDTQLSVNDLHVAQADALCRRFDQ